MTVIIEAPTIESTTNETEMTDRFFQDQEFRNKLLTDLWMSKIHYHDLPDKLKYRRGVIMNSDIREVLIYAPKSVYRNVYSIEGMCINLLNTEKNFFSLREYQMLIDNMREADSRPSVWVRAILFIKKSQYREAVLEYLFTGKMYI